jgi:hypothetical protein
METFVVRIFVDDSGAVDGPRGVVEHIGTGESAVFDGREALLELVERGLRQASEIRRQRTTQRVTEEAQP